MSLFKSVEKWKGKSEESVRVKAELTKHSATFRAVMAAFEAGVPEVERLVSEISTREAGGSLQGLQGLKDELVKAKQNRDRPFQNYKSIQADLRLELESLTRPFISEQDEAWQTETVAVSSQKVNEEIPPKDEPGIFTIGRKHVVKTNLKAIRVFREKSLQLRNVLRGMTTCSIPQIREFIEKAELEMREISLTPIIIEQDGGDFQHDRLDSRPESGRTSSGFIPPTGKGVEIKNPGESDKQNGQLFSDLDRARMIFKPILPK